MSKPWNLIGAALPRLEDARLLTGRGRFADDERPAGGAWVAQFVRAPHPHADILAIDVEAASAMPGAHAVLTAADYRQDGGRPIAHRPNPAAAVDHRQRAFQEDRTLDLPHWPLAESCVRHLGEPVAVVVAASLAAAKDAAEAVEVEYAPRPALVDAVEAVAPGAPQIREDAPGNLCVDERFGDETAVRAAFEKAAHVVRRRFRHGRIVNNQMEPRSVLAAPDADAGQLVITTGSQGALRLRDGLCQALDLTPEELRVISRDVGGGFGPRSFLYPEVVAVAWAARRLGRAVRWTADRSESFLTDYQGRDTQIEAALALDQEGRILALDVDILSNVGAHTVAFVPLANASRIVTTVYDIPAVAVRTRAALTTTVPTVPYRGAGRPEATAALEQLIDETAESLGIDRIRLRRMNLVSKDAMPFVSPLGLTYDSGDFGGNMSQALALADWDGAPARRDDARARGRLFGIGVANYIESPVGDPRERIALSISPEGDILLTTGTHSTGQGHETTFAQVAATLLQMPIDAIRFRSGDSGFVTMGGGTHSDRSMRIAGALLHDACVDIVATAKAACAQRWNCDPAEIPFDDGVLRDPGSNSSMSLAEVAALLERDDATELSSTQSFVGRMPAHPTGTAVCEVEIDPETGQLWIVRYTSVDDAGRPVNPLILHGQVHGGIAQGIGETLTERLEYDPETGQLLTGAYTDYAMPRADNLPDLTVELVEDPTAGNPLGIKGGGEAGITPAAGAIGNAIADALRPFDPPEMFFPVSAEWIWRVIQSGRRKESGDPD